MMETMLPTLEASVAGGSPFRMFGTREVLERFYPGDNPLLKQTVALERALVESPGLALDLAKALVEGVCKTVLRERGDDEGALARLKMHELVKQTLRIVPLAAPDGGDAQWSASLEKTSAGLLNVVVGIAELRNRGGFASHGRDLFAHEPTAVHAYLAARSADAVVSFLIETYKAHTRAEQSAAAPEWDPDLKARFDEYVDETNPPVLIFDLPYRASEVLNLLDREAYRERLLEFASTQEAGSEP